MLTDLFKKAGLYAIAGVKGVGKTTLITSIAEELRNESKENTCLYFYNGSIMENGHILSDTTNSIDLADSPMNTGIIYLHSNWARSDHKLAAVIIDDYRFLLRLENIFGLDLSKNERILYLLTRLKSLSDLYDIPVIIACDVDDDYIYGRSVKRPLLSDIQDSQYIKAFADKIILLYRDEMIDSETERKGVTDLRVVNPHDESYEDHRFAYIAESGQYCKIQ